MFLKILVRCCIGFHRIDLSMAKNLPVALQGNFPPKSYLIEQYAKFTGFSMDRLVWYEVFSYWKSSIIAQQLFKRYVDGETSDQRMKNFGRSAKVLVNLTKRIMKE